MFSCPSLALSLCSLRLGLLPNSSCSFDAFLFESPASRVCRGQAPYAERAEGGEIPKAGSGRLYEGGGAENNIELSVKTTEANRDRKGRREEPRRPHRDSEGSEETVPEMKDRSWHRGAPQLCHLVAQGDSAVPVQKE